MEFGFRAVDGRGTLVTESLSGVTNVGQPSFQGLELGQIGFSGNVPAPVPELFSARGAFFQPEMEIREQIMRREIIREQMMRLEIIREQMRREIVREQMRREIEKDEIRKEIVAGDIAAARRRELEEEVRREMAMERGLLVPQQVSTTLNQRMNVVVDNAKIFGTRQSQLPQQVDNKDKVIILARPYANVKNIAKPKAVAPPMVDDDNDEHSVTSLQIKIKPKHRWSCELCDIRTTCKEGLDDHFRGRKHRAKEAALRTPIIGFDRRSEPLIPLLHRHIIPTQIGTPKPGNVDEDEQESQTCINQNTV